MNIPNLSIHVEPVEGVALVHAVLAAKSSRRPPDGQLLLVLTITNNELQTPIKLTKIAVSFVGPPNLAPSEIEVKPLATSSGLVVPAGHTMRWTLLESWNKNILLPVPAPRAMTLSLLCEGFDPLELTMPLIPYACPAAGGGYQFPTRAMDLKLGEFWTGCSSGDYHRARACDIKVYTYRNSTKEWRAVSDEAGFDTNESFLIWNKPVFAIADGVIVQFCDTMPDNTPGSIPALLDFAEGNHFYIQHGPDLVLYAHFMRGTLDASLRSLGASVAKGQFLGHVGNSGRSWEPHLHISVLRTTSLPPPPEEPLRPLPFSDIGVLDIHLVSTVVWPPHHDPRWNVVSAQCLPGDLSAIWPGPLDANPDEGPVRYGTSWKLRHAATGCRLHSHAFTYSHPGSSWQQQVTCFADADDNDFWRIKAAHGQPTRDGEPVRHGSIVRLEHVMTGRNLHSHAGFPSPVAGQQEVTCFGQSGVGDENDDWRVEVEDGGGWDVEKQVRLIHVATHAALHSHDGFAHAAWTRGQQEVTCFAGRDANDLWFASDLRRGEICSTAPISELLLFS